MTKDTIDKTESGHFACGSAGMMGPHLYLKQPYSQNKQICIKLSQKLEHRKHA